MQLRPIAGLTLTVGLALGLAGCISPPPVAEPAAESQATETDEGAAPDEGGQPDEGSQPDASDDAEQEEAASGGDAPVEGWPAEVPVPDGEVQQDASTGGQTIVAFEVDDVAAGEDYAAALEAAGFAQMEEGTTEVGGVVAEVFQGADHIVAVSTVESGELVLLSVAIQAL